MPATARLTDSISGITLGEHSGHIPPHGPLPISGEITDSCSPNVIVNDLPAATTGSITIENDGCCVSDKGSVGMGSGTVFINGKPAARLGDALNPHNGVATISGGSSNVFIGG